MKRDASHARATAKTRRDVNSRRQHPPQSDASRRKCEERDCAQFLRAQQKLVGKKTTEEHARVRLIQRQDDAARKRNLHQNGPNRSARDDPVARPGTGSARPQSARDSELRRSAVTTARPQSAKPARQSGTQAPDGGVDGHHINVALLERCYYNQVPLTTYLTASRSAPRLQAALRSSNRLTQSDSSVPKASSAPEEPGPRSTEKGDEGSGRHHVVVYMRRVEMQDESEDEGSPLGQQITPSSVSWSAPPAQRHDRPRGLSGAQTASIRSARTESD